MSAQLKVQERAVLRAVLGLGDHAADIVDAAAEVLLDLKQNPIGRVEQCSRSVCKVVRIRVLRKDTPVWKYVWPEYPSPDRPHIHCPANSGGGHAFTVMEPRRPY